MTTTQFSAVFDHAQFLVNLGHFWPILTSFGHVMDLRGPSGCRVVTWRSKIVKLNLVWSLVTTWIYRVFTVYQYCSKSDWGERPIQKRFSIYQKFNFRNDFNSHATNQLFCANLCPVVPVCLSLSAVPQAVRGILEKFNSRVPTYDNVNNYLNGIFISWFFYFNDLVGIYGLWSIHDSIGHFLVIFGWSSGYFSSHKTNKNILGTRSK